MNTSEMEKIWEDVKKVLKENIPESSYETWIEPLEIIEFEDNQIKLISGQSIAIEYLKKNQYPEILDGFKTVLNQEVTVSLEYDKETFDKIKKTITTTSIIFIT